jgi:hypothetical protein
MGRGVAPLSFHPVGAGTHEARLPAAQIRGERRQNIGTIATEAQNFDKLFADAEDLLQTEADSFFKFRITDWESHDRST